MNQEEVLNPPIKNKYNFILRVIQAIVKVFSNISFKSKCCYESECNNNSKESESHPPHQTPPTNL